MTQISLHELAGFAVPQSGISFARIRGEVGGLDNTQSISSSNMSLRAIQEQYQLIDNFGQATPFNTVPTLEKVLEYQTIDANPGFYLITDGTDNSPTTITGQYDGYFGTDNGNTIVTDDESGDTSLVNTIVINNGEMQDVILKSLLNQARGETTEPESLLFINNGTISSSGRIQYDVVNQVYRISPAISTGPRWTEGSVITIINNGTIIGAGGNGGSTHLNKEDGKDGGDAIELSYQITIDNKGYIFGGGGGGAGTFYGGGGGGGAGKISGKGGEGTEAANNGIDGGINSGGSPGTPLPNSDAFGTQVNATAGGGLGSPGAGNLLYKGGKAGKIINKNNYAVEGISDGLYMTDKLKGEVA